MKRYVLALGFALAGAMSATPLLAEGGLVFEPVVPEGIEAERVEKIVEYQQSFGAEQLAALQEAGYGAYGAIAVPVAMAGAPVFLAMLESREVAEEAVLTECESQHGTACALIGVILPEG